MIKGTKTRLCLLEEGDLPRLAEWRSDPVIARQFFSPWEVAESEQADWYRAYRANPAERMWIVQTPEHHAIGCLALTALDWRNRSAELGRVLIGEQGYLCQGYAYDAVQALQGYVFEELGLHRLEARVFADNKAARGLYGKAGFRVEGLLRAAIWRGGRWRDILIYARLAEGPTSTRECCCPSDLSCNAYADVGVEQ